MCQVTEPAAEESRCDWHDVGRHVRRRGVGSGSGAGTLHRDWLADDQLRRYVRFGRHQTAVRGQAEKVTRIMQVW